MEENKEAEGVSHEGWGQSVPAKVAIGLALSLIPTLSLLGNLLVCIAVFTCYKLKKTQNYFIVSLAVADMLVAVLVMTFAIPTDVLGRWLFGSVYCLTWISFDILCSTASILNLCAISVDRYARLTKPLEYDIWLTTPKSILIISLVWSISAITSFVPNHLGWGHLSTPTNSCLLNLSPLYALVSSIISFYIPCIIMVFTYWKIYKVALVHRKCIMDNDMSAQSPMSTVTAPFLSSNILKFRKPQIKAEITLGVVMGAFLVCWLPFFIVNPLLAYCTDCVSLVTFKFFSWLGYFNSFLNPFIYSVFNSDFREAFYTLALGKSLNLSCT